MDLFIMRHGQAHPQVTDDASRTLTQQGIEASQKIARLAFQEKTAAPIHIMSSCYVRALQTARTVAEVVGYNAAIPVTDQLLPDSDPREALHFLANQKSKSLLVVSHQPLMGQLISLFVDGVVQDRHVSTSAVAYITFDEPMMIGAGRLQWLLEP